jgi:hypothetical protein
MSTISTPIGETPPPPPTVPPPVPSPPPNPQVVSAEEWEQDAQHLIWTHGGKRILVRIPDLFELVRSDALPSALRTIALEVVTRQAGLDQGDSPTTDGEPRKLSWEEVQQTAELFEHLAYSMIVQPVITVEQFRRLPSEDREMLRDIAMRQRDTDARGVVLGAVPLSRFAPFREEHGCAEDCPACAAALTAISTRSPSTL